MKTDLKHTGHDSRQKRLLMISVDFGFVALCFTLK